MKGFELSGLSAWSTMQNVMERSRIEMQSGICMELKAWSSGLNVCLGFWV